MRVSTGSHQETVATTVTFALLPKPLGGYCAFWRCPGCQRRCEVLYMLGTAWRCRICGNITYRSSNQSDKRVSRLLASRNLVAELAQLQVGGSISELERMWKVYELIQQRTNREVRRQRGRWARRGRHRSGSRRSQH